MRKFKSFMAIALALSIFMTPAIATAETTTQPTKDETKEEAAKVQNVHQTAASYHSISLSWDFFNIDNSTTDIKEESSESSAETLSEPTVSYFYEIHLAEVATGSAVNVEEAKDWSLKSTTYDNYVTLYDLDPGKDYFVRVIAKTKTMPRSTVTKYYDKVKVSTIPGKANVPDITDLSASEVALSWNAVPGANKYNVIGYLAGDSEKISYGNTNDTNIRITNLAAGTKYQFIVYAVNDNGKYQAVNDSEYNALEVTTLPQTINNIVIKNDYNGRKAQIVSWDPADVEGYEILVKASGSTAETVYEEQCNTCEITKFVSGAWQSAKVRGYITINGVKKYTSYSNAVYFTKQTQVSKVKQIKKKGKKTKQVKISWKKVKGSNSYSVYISRKPTTGYCKVGTTKKKSYVVNKIKGLPLKAGKSYYVRVLSNKKAGKTNYTSFISNKYRKVTVK